MAEDPKHKPADQGDTEKPNPPPQHREVGPEDEERGQQTDRQPFNRDD